MKSIFSIETLVRTLVLAAQFIVAGNSHASFDDDLFRYVTEGNTEQVAVLLEKGANPNYVPEKDKTTLEWDTDRFPRSISVDETTYSNADVYERLIKKLKEANISINEMSETRRSVTFSGHYVDIALPLLGAWVIPVSDPESVPSEFPRRESKSEISLGLAAERTSSSWEQGGLFTLENGTFELRLGHGLNIGHSDESPTPLMMASYGGHLEIVRLLIQKGADVNYKWENRAHSALMYACKGGHVEVVKKLLAAGAKKEVNYRNHSGETALSLAEEDGLSEIAEVLIKAGAVSEGTIFVEMSDLEKAIWAGNAKKIEALLADSEKGSPNVNELISKIFKVFGYKETPETGSLTSPEHASIRPLLDSAKLDSDSINRLFAWMVRSRHYRYEEEFQRLFDDPRITEESLQWAMEYGLRSQSGKDLVRQISERRKLNSF